MQLVPPPAITTSKGHRQMYISPLSPPYKISAFYMVEKSTMLAECSLAFNIVLSHIKQKHSNAMTGKNRNLLI